MAKEYKSTPGEVEMWSTHHFIDAVEYILAQDRVEAEQARRSRRK